MELLEDGGRLCYITPPSWMTPSSPLLNDIFRKYQVEYLNLSGADKYFTVGSQFSWYVIQKVPAYRNTEVDCIYKKKQYKSSVDFTATVMQVPPILLTDLCLSICEKITGHADDKITFEKSYAHESRKDTISKTRTDVFCYPSQHTGDKVLWSSTPHEVMDKQKVLMSISGYPKAVYDNGEKGVTQGCLYILADTMGEGEKLTKILNSRSFQFLMAVCKWSGWNNKDFLNTLPYPKDIPEGFTDQDLYKHFNLTAEEITLIEETVS